MDRTNRTFWRLTSAGSIRGALECVKVAEIYRDDGVNAKHFSPCEVQMAKLALEILDSLAESIEDNEGGEG